MHRNQRQTPQSQPQANFCLKRWINAGRIIVPNSSGAAEFSNEAVHDLQDRCAPYARPDSTSEFDLPAARCKLNCAFKDQLDEFDDLRDTIILAEVSETIQELPQLQKFQQYLQAVERIS
jgi:hypothetical protein